MRNPMVPRLPANPSAARNGYGLGFSGKNWPQRPDEARALLKIAVKANVRSYLEIGCRFGDTYHYIMSALPEGSRGMALDMPGGIFGNQDSGDYLMRAHEDIRTQGKSSSVILGSSFDPENIRLIAEHAPFDMVFIDGDHRYDGVKRDWETFGPMGKIVAFHDIDGDAAPPRRDKLAVDVPRLWREIVAAGYKTRNLVSPHRGMGIGVVWLE